ncbi:hypothetical protein C0J52_06036, partial [Blattella germanica]
TEKWARDGFESGGSEEIQLSDSFGNNRSVLGELAGKETPFLGEIVVIQLETGVPAERVREIDDFHQFYDKIMAQRRKLTLPQSYRALGIIESGLRQIDVAEALGLSQSVISRLANRMRATGVENERPRTVEDKDAIIDTDEINEGWNLSNVKRLLNASRHSAKQLSRTSCRMADSAVVFAMRWSTRTLFNGGENPDVHSGAVTLNGSYQWTGNCDALRFGSVFGIPRYLLRIVFRLFQGRNRKKKCIRVALKSFWTSLKHFHKK